MTQDTRQDALARTDSLRIKLDHLRVFHGFTDEQMDWNRPEYTVNREMADTAPHFDCGATR